MTGSGYVVVGAGIAGASVAYHLAARTDDPVVVYDRGSPLGETTAKSFGLFGFYGDGVQRPMKRYGLRLYNRLLVAPGKARYRPLGRLDLATTPAGANQLETATDREAASEVEYLTGEDLTARLVTPLLDVTAVAGVRFRPGVGRFTPRAIASVLLDQARDRGATVRTDTPVIGIARDGEHAVGVDTPDGPVAAEAVVCAAGPWNRALLGSVGVDLPLRHTLAPGLRLRPDGPIGHRLPNVSHVETGHSFLGDGGSVLVGHKPADGYAAGEVMDPDAVGDEIPGELRSGALDVAGRLFPRLRNATVEAEWLGLRSETPDGNPLVGPTGVEGLSVVAFSDSGIQLAPAAGSTVARQLTGGPSQPWDAGVAVDRFDTGSEPNDGAAANGHDSY